MSSFDWQVSPPRRVSVRTPCLFTRFVAKPRSLGTVPSRPILLAQSVQDHKVLREPRLTFLTDLDQQRVSLSCVLTVGSANKKPKHFGGLGLGAAVHDKGRYKEEPRHETIKSPKYSGFFVSRFVRVPRPTRKRCTLIPTPVSSIPS